MIHLGFVFDFGFDFVCSLFVAPVSDVGSLSSLPSIVFGESDFELSDDDEVDVPEGVSPRSLPTDSPRDGPVNN